MAPAPAPGSPDSPAPAADPAGAATLLAEAGDLLGAVVDVRRRIHRQPEIGLQNPRTQQVVLDELAPLGLDRVETGAAVTSVVADLVGGRPGPVVLLRADTDALPMPEDTGLDFASEVPGAMHACGHDAHVAMLLGAARLLSARREALPGTVRFMFQPGEEGFHGARSMIEEGVLDVAGERPAAAFAIHQTPSIPSGIVATRSGPLMASADVVRITVRGRGGHASQPHEALDPVPVACEIVLALQTWVTRRVNAFDPAVVTVGRISGGTTNNVIPECVELEATVRAVSERTRASVQTGVRQVAEGIAAAHGASAEVTLEPGYPVTVNSGFADRVRHVAGEVLGPGTAIEMPAPVMGAEDWSYVLQEVPGAMAFLGTQPPGTKPGEVAPCHSNRMQLDEAALAAGVALYAAVALDVLHGGGA